jgi:hypothetical protein
VPNPKVELVLQDVSLFGLATPKLIAPGQYAGDKSRAKQVLAALSKTGRLRRYLCRFSGSEPPMAYYSLTEKPLGLKELRARYAVAAYVKGNGDNLRLLDDKAFHELFDPIAQAIGLDAPAYRPCCLALHDRTIQLVWPLSMLDLNRTVTRLQVFICTEPFRLWHAFAKQGKFNLICLVPGKRRADELSLWLERRPLLSPFSNPPIKIDIQVRAAERLRPGE